MIKFMSVHLVASTIQLRATALHREIQVDYSECLLQLMLLVQLVGHCLILPKSVRALSHVSANKVFCFLCF